MTTFNYARPRATAERLIARYGQTAAIRRTVNSGPEYSPTQTDTDYACTLAELQIDLSKVDGTLIGATDRMAYVSTSGLSIEPTVQDKIVIGSVAHTIKMVKPLSPDGTVVFWEIVFVN